MAKMAGTKSNGANIRRIAKKNKAKKKAAKKKK